MVWSIFKLVVSFSLVAALNHFSILLVGDAAQLGHHVVVATLHWFADEVTYKYMRVWALALPPTADPFNKNWGCGSYLGSSVDPLPWRGSDGYQIRNFRNYQLASQR